MTKKEKKRVPELRFAGFEGEWKKLELRKAASINPKNGELPDSFIYVDLESVNNGVLEKEERISKKDAPSRAQRLLERDDILYQTVRPYQKNNLYFDKEDKDYVASTGYAQIRTDNNSKYLYQYVHTALFVNKVLLRCTGTSYPAINSTDLSKIRVSIPSKEEQQKIATFLTTIDTRIQQLEKKKTLLEQYKKGVMQKIFSQEIRFKDQDGKEFGTWEEKRLGDISTFFSGGTPRSTNKSFYKGSIPFIGSGNISDESVDSYITTEALNSSSAKMVEKDDLLYALYGATSGEVAISKMNGAINQAVLCIRTETNKYYLYQLLKYNKNKIVETYIQGGQGNLSAKIIKDLQFKLPCLAEQTKIAHFLSALDRKTAVMDGQIEKTKEWKKGLLQRMFV